MPITGVVFTATVIGIFCSSFYQNLIMRLSVVDFDKIDYLGRSEDRITRIG